MKAGFPEATRENLPDVSVLGIPSLGITPSRQHQ
jgi:hypothetical protein